MTPSPKPGTRPDLPAGGSWKNMLLLGSGKDGLAMTFFTLGVPAAMVLILHNAEEATREAPAAWAPLMAFFRMNAWRQLMLFLAISQLPCALTGCLSYVDIAWPASLCLVAWNGYSIQSATNPSASLRTILVCGCMFLHGLRMFLGALYGFGRRTHYTYWMTKDLPRYEYAKWKWVDKWAMPAWTWYIRIQIDSLTQCLASATCLALPVAAVCARAAAEGASPAGQSGFGWDAESLVELCGVAVWSVSWFFESMADGQKIGFIKQARKDGTLSTAVLGYAPYDGPEYSLWTLCRHPNYFCEWSAWWGLLIAALPSVWRVGAGRAVIFKGGVIWGSPLRVVLMLLWIMTPITFYDCLVFFTGAAPAEHYSSRKRPAYAAYMAENRCFFPFPMPFVDHHYKPEWAGTVQEGVKKDN